MSERTTGGRQHQSESLDASALLDSPAEDVFDKITQLVAAGLDVPVALISLVAENRQFFKSQMGLPEPWASARETPLSHSFCKHVTESGEPLIVSDARAEALVRDNLAVRDLGVIAYAGVPIEGPGGHVIGSLCAIDSKPRLWSPAEVRLLRALSGQVTMEIESRRETARLVREIARHRAREDEARLTARLNVHDIRSPLTAVMLSLETLGMMGPLNEDQRDAVQICFRNVEAVLRRVDEMLDVGSVELQGAAAMHLVAHDPSALVSLAVAQVRPLAAERRIELTVDRSREGGLPAKIPADTDKVVRVLVNLLGNAIKFNRAGGSVTVTVSVAPGGVRFEVRDDGPGIADASRIFDEGFRGDEAATTRHSTGLGLTFCKKVIEAHRGEIWVDSRPGWGRRLGLFYQGDKKVADAAVGIEACARVRGIGAGMIGYRTE